MSQSQSQSQAQAFLAANASLAYDDAKNGNFWTKLKDAAILSHKGHRFPDGSHIIQDPMGCSLCATA